MSDIQDKNQEIAQWQKEEEQIPISRTESQTQQAEQQQKQILKSNKPTIIKQQEEPIVYENTQTTQFKQTSTLPELTSISNAQMQYEQDHLIGDIHIAITGNVQKGTTFSSYTTYLIVGEDAKGKFELARRYSEFDSLRSLIKDRWPGCFIPTLPQKNLIKNSPQLIAERERLLDDFLKKIATNKNIYYGDEVQIFLRSGEIDVNSNFEKQPKLNLQDIINRYKNLFDNLAGKQINSGATIKISTFKTSLKRIQQQLPQLLESIVNLAEARDHLNLKLPGITQIMQSYQKNTMIEFLEGNTNKLVFANVDNIQIQSQEQTIRKVSKSNPFWFFSDLIKIQQKDCASFIETIELIDKYNEKRLTCQNDIKNLQRQIEELALGNSTLSSMTTRKSKEQVKKGLQEKNKKLIEERHNLIELGDMISALISYVEIDNYKNLKKKYYSTVLKKLTGHEAYGVIHLQHIWNEVFEAVDNIKLQQSS